LLIYAFAKNQSVKKGEILFIIDQSTYKAALDNAEASVASNRATMDLQQSNAARGHKLTKLSISAEQLETHDLQAKSASRRCGIEQDDIESAKRRNLVRWALPKVSEVANFIVTGLQGAFLVSKVERDLVFAENFKKTLFSTVLA